MLAQGDPIESNALRRAVAPVAPAAVAALPEDFVFSAGAVKAVTGHLEGSAGLAGLAQAVAALQQQALMPLRYRSINPYVANSLDNWHVKSRYVYAALASSCRACRQQSVLHCLFVLALL